MSKPNDASEMSGKFDDLSRRLGILEDHFYLKSTQKIGADTEDIEADRTSLTEHQIKSIESIPGKLRKVWPSGAATYLGSDGILYLIMPDGLIARQIKCNSPTTDA